MNILSGIVTFVLLIAVGFGLFFFLLLALNGFSERDANPAMVFYIIWMIIFAIVFGVVSFFLTKFLIAKAFNAILAVVLSIITATAIGTAIDFGGLLVGTIIASEVRQSYQKK